MRIEDLSAYQVLEKREIADLNSVSFLLKHKKSGARVALISNDDENKVFYIGFRTPPADSTGVAHILEHSVLCGSKESGRDRIEFQSKLLPLPDVIAHLCCIIIEKINRKFCMIGENCRKYRAALNAHDRNDRHCNGQRASSVTGNIIDDRHFLLCILFHN